MSNYIKGIIGAIIGGVIGVIPWLLVYVYGGYMISLLALFIGIGASRGYKKMGGMMDKKTPLIIGIVSVIVVALSTLLIIPIMLVMKEGFSVNEYTLGLLYNSSEFMGALIHDLCISTLFTIIGIIPVTNDIKREVGVEIKSETNLKKQQKNIEKMKEIFTKLNALDKENAISYEEIKENFVDEDEKTFKQLKNMMIIKKYKGNYYYSINNEKTPGLGALMISFKIIIIIILVIALINIFI